MEHTLDITLTYNINGEEYTDSRSVIVYVTSNKAIIPSDVDIPDTGYVQIGNVIYDRSSLILTVAIVIVLCLSLTLFFKLYKKTIYKKIKPLKDQKSGFIFKKDYFSRASRTSISMRFFCLANELL